jgi:hypothetical protein
MEAGVLMELSCRETFGRRAMVGVCHLRRSSQVPAGRLLEVEPWLLWDPLRYLE